ncbi:MAG: hypothetical protein ACREMO_08735 [Gemmatimonadales bacterium]
MTKLAAGPFGASLSRGRAMSLERLRASLADRYRIDVGAGGRPSLRGQGGMATVCIAVAVC